MPKNTGDAGAKSHLVLNNTSVPSLPWCTGAGLPGRGGVVFLFMYSLAKYGLVFLGTLLAPDCGFVLHPLDLSHLVVTARLQADGA